jgi:hypothetical protein
MARIGLFTKQIDAGNQYALLTGGGETLLPRHAETLATPSLPTGQMRLGYFTARRSEPITQVRAYSGSTAATSVTLARIGIFSVASNGDLTLIHSIANDATLFTATATAYTKALDTTFNKVAGTFYAVGELVVCSGATGTTTGIAVTNSAAAAVAPRLNGLVTSLADLPSSVAAGSVSATGSCIQAYLLP